MASGDNLLSWDALTGYPTTTDGATADLRNQHRSVDFDATFAESFVYEGVMPEHYAATTGLTLELTWAATSATSGDVIWIALFERIQAGTTDIDSDSFGTSTTFSASTANGTSGVPVTASATMADGVYTDSIAAGEAFRLKITRDADNGSDTMTGDAELIRIDLLET